MAGTIAHQDVLAQAKDIVKVNVKIGTNNTPALYWQTKGSTTTTGPAAYLLQLVALHQ